MRIGKLVCRFLHIIEKVFEVFTLWKAAVSTKKEPAEISLVLSSIDQRPFFSSQWTYPNDKECITNSYSLMNEINE